MVMCEMIDKRKKSEEEIFYKINDIFDKNSKIDVNEVMKKSFLFEIKSNEQSKKIV